MTTGQILEWADAHHARTGCWPTASEERVVGAHGETWLHVDGALKNGRRGLPGGWTLAKLLNKRRSAKIARQDRTLYIEQILDWVDGYHRRTGKWPASTSGPIPSAPGDTWFRVQLALKHGKRGLPGESSIAKLLAEHRGVRDKTDLKPLTIPKILRWADKFYERTGRWPKRESGIASERDGTTWMAVQDALYLGGRGLPGGTSLAQIFDKHRGVRNIHRQPKLTIKLILEWADLHHERTGRWPGRGSGKVKESPAEDWSGVDRALKVGIRGVEGGSSLAKLLQQKRGKRYLKDLPPITEAQILKWAMLHHKRTGRWPTQAAGPILDAPGENWRAIDSALYKGLRGFPGGSSVAQLLVDHGLKPDYHTRWSHK